MRSLYAWLVTLVTVSFVALAVAQAEPSGHPGYSVALVTGVAVLTLAAALGARYLAVIIVAFSLTVGSRSRQHREVLGTMVAPRHPNTQGRPRPRAPSLSGAIA
ncbi:hypothetical protein GCM10027416_18800 [Okibacterium endophyticum]